MKERPILFSASMVRAILDGSKTQTRRAVRKQFADEAEVAEVSATTSEGWQTSGHSGLWWDDSGACLDDAVRCPYGIPGDRLWVRECWAETIDINDLRSHGDWPDRPHVKVDGEDRNVIIFRADGEWEWCDDDGFHTEKSNWKPSIFMPRWASRITLEITAVRVERLQDISEADAIAEGISRVPFRPDDGWPICDGYMIGPDDAKTSLQTTAAKAYRGLWDSINGFGSWALNPFVWVVEFKRVPQ